MVNAQTIEIIRGNSSDVFNLSIKKYILDDNWTCKMIIRKDYNNPKLVEKEAKFDYTDNKFKTIIAPQESELLPVGDYMLTFVFENLTELFRKELQYKLRVIASGVMD